MALPEDSSPRCVVCSGTGPLKRCARCHTTQYCSTSCQKLDWKSHKPHCNTPVADSSSPWYDKYRLCRDKAKHEGRLELITWSVPASSQRPTDEYDFCEDMGWGNCVAGEDSDGLRQKFETEFAGSEERFYEYWPQGFRWTCCGYDGDQNFGCDHHGKGSTPCTCDFCKVGGQTLRALDVLCGHAWLTVRCTDGQSHSEQRLQAAYQLASRQGAGALERTRFKIHQRACGSRTHRNNAGSPGFARQRLSGMSLSCNS